MCENVQALDNCTFDSIHLANIHVVKGLVLCHWIMPKVHCNGVVNESTSKVKVTSTFFSAVITSTLVSAVMFIIGFTIVVCACRCLRLHLLMLSFLSLCLLLLWLCADS